MIEGKLLTLSLKDKHVVATIKLGKRIVEGRMNKIVAARTSRGYLRR